MPDLKVYLTADTKKFNRRMRKADRVVAKMSRKIEQYGAIAGGAFLTAGAAAMRMAIDAEETRNKFATVFKGVAHSADTMARELQMSYGLGREEAQKLLSGTGDLLTGFGFTEKAALDLSGQVQRLAVDLASFQNLEGGAKRASEALTKALLGETEQAKALGIVIRQKSDEYTALVDTAMKAQGVSLQQAKAMAALKLAVMQSKNAVGDYARTSDSAANQLKLLKTRLADVTLEFGNLGLKILDVGSGASSANDRILALTRSIESQSDEIAHMVSTVGIYAITGATAMWVAFDSTLGNIGRLVRNTVNEIVDWVKLSMGNTVTIMEWVNTNGKNIFRNLGTAIAEMWQGVWKSAKQMAGGFFDYVQSGGQVSMHKGFDRALGELSLALKRTMQAAEVTALPELAAKSFTGSIVDVWASEGYKSITTLGEVMEDQKRKLAALDENLRKRVFARAAEDQKRQAKQSAKTAATAGAPGAGTSPGIFRNTATTITDQFMRIGGMVMGRGDLNNTGTYIQRQTVLQERMVEYLQTLANNGGTVARFV